MNNRHIQFFGKNIQAHTVCGKTFFSIDVDTFEPPFEVAHFKGEHNLEGCQGCRNSLEIMKTEMNDYFKNFPNCCSAHQNLMKQDWFYVGNYSDLGEKVAYKVIYMLHHAINNIERDDWYLEITSYIEYVLGSFGQFPSDCGAPAGISQAKGYLERLLEVAELNNKEMNPRKEQIIDYVSKYGEVKEEKNKSDINLLISIYERWIKVFPFELELFSEQKERFENSFPLIHGDVVENKYTGLAKVQMITQPVLLDYLNTITKNVLYSVDTNKLLEAGKITNSQKHQLDIATSKYKLNQDKNKLQFFKKEKAYINSIKQWLKNEEEFIQTFNSINLPKAEVVEVKTEKKVEDSFMLIEAQTSNEPIKELFNRLVIINCLSPESKQDFIKAFNGKIPNEKIDWIGDFGDLRSFISLLKSENKIKNVGNRHWLIAMKLFLRNGILFDNKTISDTKPTKNHTRILKIVQSITK
jgi:hypothetical protein